MLLKNSYTSLILHVWLSALNKAGCCGSKMHIRLSLEDGIIYMGGIIPLYWQENQGSAGQRIWFCQSHKTRTQKVLGVWVQSLYTFHYSQPLSRNQKSKCFLFWNLHDNIHLIIFSFRKVSLGRICASFRLCSDYDGEQKLPQNPTFEWLTQEAAEDATDKIIIYINAFQQPLIRAPQGREYWGYENS